MLKTNNHLCHTNHTIRRTCIREKGQVQPGSWATSTFFGLNKPIALGDPRGVCLGKSTLTVFGPDSEAGMFVQLINETPPITLAWQNRRRTYKLPSLSTFATTMICRFEIALGGPVLAL